MGLQLRMLLETTAARQLEMTRAQRRMLTFTCSLTRRIGYTAQQIRPGLVRACAARALVEALFFCEQK